MCSKYFQIIKTFKWKELFKNHIKINKTPYFQGFFLNFRKFESNFKLNKSNHIFYFTVFEVKFISTEFKRFFLNNSSLRAELDKLSSHFVLLLTCKIIYMNFHLHPHFNNEVNTQNKYPHQVLSQIIQNNYF